jgi:hypothetical protein
VDEGRGADVVPHLAGDHGEDEQEGDERPGRPVVEELQVVAPQVQQPADQGRQHHHSHRSCNRVNSWQQGQSSGRLTLLDCVADPDPNPHPPDPHVFGPPGSGSGSTS